MVYEKSVLEDGVAVVPEGYTEISGSAFKGRKDLTALVIPESVTEIGEGAFASCPSLETITLGKGIKTIDKTAFQDTSPKTILVPAPKTAFFQKRLPARLHALTVADSIVLYHHIFHGTFGLLKRFPEADVAKTPLSALKRNIPYLAR